MSIFRNDTLGSWTRGGQAIVHNVRMTTQVFFQTSLAGLAIWVGGIIWYVLEKSSDYQRFVAMKEVGLDKGLRRYQAHYEASAREQQTRLDLAEQLEGRRSVEVMLS